MKKLLSVIILSVSFLFMQAQSANKVYDPSINPNLQISEAITKAASNGKYVIAQLGGNWCRWCIMFAKFVENDPELKKLVEDNYEFIHVNYDPRDKENNENQEETRAALKKLGNPIRFGFPVLIVIDSKGNVIHTQDSSFLESGEGYDKKKVTRFFESWTPKAVESAK